MTNTYVSPKKIYMFYEDTVTRSTAFNYSELMKKAKTPFITLEKRNDGNYNLVGGFKYLNGIRLLNEKKPLYCTLVESFQSEKERKLAILQRALANREKPIYKEILIHELIHEYKMSKNEISIEIGEDAKKIQNYMYKQVIPAAYYKAADRLNVKSLVLAIYCANNFTSYEKIVLTELCLQENKNLRFKRSHLSIYMKYRKSFNLFEDIAKAKKQVMNAVNVEEAHNEYWKSVPHPNNLLFKLDSDDKNDFQH
ncbi:hypothetical protein RZN25_17415 [Bacillaceae bacterium S4-13-56]